MSTLPDPWRPYPDDYDDEQMAMMERKLQSQADADADRADDEQAEAAMRDGPGTAARIAGGACDAVARVAALFNERRAS